MEVNSLGISAEYGNNAGAVLNIVTRQGSNDFRYDASYYFQADGLTSHPVELPCDSCTREESAYRRADYRDLTTHLGGPFLQDRLWFFLGYQYLLDAESQPGADPDFPRRFRQDSLFWKINWQISPRWKLLHSSHLGLYAFPETPSTTRPFETTVSSEGHETATTYALLTHVVSENTFWEVRASGLRQPEETTPQNGDPTLAHRFDFATGVASGGGAFLSKFNLLRDTVQGKLSHYATDFLGGDHDFKFGFEFNRGEDWQWFAYPGGALYYDYGGDPYLAILSAPSTDGGEFKAFGVFAEDVVRLSNRVTVQLGLRFDRNRAISPDLPERDDLGNETGNAIRGLGDLFTWNNLAPRLGLNWALTADGKTAMRASYGRLYQGVLTGVLSGFHPGIAPLTQALFDPETGEYSFVLSVTDFGSGLVVDSGTKPPFTDQYSIGFDRELGPDLGLHATYAHKRGRNYMGWRDDGVYGNDIASLPDGGTLTVFPLLSPPEELEYLLTTRDDYRLRYDGIVLTVEKRWARRWQALFSYSLSEARGLLASSSVTPGFSQTSNAFFGGFGSDPNTTTNATGQLSNDRTNMFRIQTTAELPKVDVVLGVNFQYLTGKPWAAATFVPLPQGFQQIFIEAPGSHRFSSQTLLDLRVSKVLRFGDRGRVEILVDLLNLLNDTAEERIATNVVERPNFGDPVAFVPPRRAMVGVKLVY